MVQSDVAVFEFLESDVRSYCRSWPVVFDQAHGSRLVTEDERIYLDFFSGAGALNYGHNNPILKRALIDYLERDGLVQGLDMFTVAKRDFLTALHENVLQPRNLRYKVMFPGPSGTSAVEAALKLARKVTGRHSIVYFTNAFHGMSLGSLSVTGNAGKRAGAGVPLTFGSPMPFDRYIDDKPADFALLQRFLEDEGSGFDRPAAVIVETIQGEGGVNVAGSAWLRSLAELCRRFEMLLIVDDVQMGCGRTGPFFSFEESAIVPDIVTLSKSISGLGLPLAIVLFRPELDIWEPGEHNGTFRGHNPAFVTATTALNTYWADDRLQRQTRAGGEYIECALGAICREYPDLGVRYRGRGMVWGVEFLDRSRAAVVCSHAFDLGLLVETSGAQRHVVKLMPALTTTPEDLEEGLQILSRAIARAA